MKTADICGSTGTCQKILKDLPDAEIMGQRKEAVWWPVNNGVLEERVICRYVDLYNPIFAGLEYFWLRLAANGYIFYMITFPFLMRKCEK